MYKLVAIMKISFKLNMDLGTASRKCIETTTQQCYAPQFCEVLSTFLILLIVHRTKCV